MKLLKYHLILFVLTFGLVKCTPVEKHNTAQIEFKITEHDFGELELNGDGECSFRFSNPGETPLIIHNVKTSCGCTVPQWPQKPIKPMNTGQIKINYDTTHPGIFRKTITVFYNGKNSPQILTIKGNIRLHSNHES